MKSITVNGFGFVFFLLKSALQRSLILNFYALHSLKPGWGSVFLNIFYSNKSFVSLNISNRWINGLDEAKSAASPIKPKPTNLLSTSSVLLLLPLISPLNCNLTAQIKSKCSSGDHWDQFMSAEHVGRLCQKHSFRLDKQATLENYQF